MEKINISITDENFLELNVGSSYLNAVITKEDEIYCSLCIELNIASEGETLNEAKENLLEAVKDYIELSVENKTPIIRLVPIEDNPLLNPGQNIVEVFRIKVNMNLSEYA
ncbi:MAG TPA: hypothetical protein VGK25_10515 [Ignavibacteria bacterium]|jgi:predicted RNase H-like HicB family nuclease